MDELLGRRAPQSLEAEQAVLGSMLIDSRCIAEVIGILRPEDFYLQQNREIYETIYSMFNFSEVVDPVTVLDKMKERGVFTEQSTGYVMQLMEITPTAANVRSYAQIVRDKSLLRAISEAASDINETVYQNAGTAAEILENAEKRIFALRKDSAGDSLEHIGTVLLKVFDRLTELAESGSAFPGLSTGLMDLDRKINGLNKSDLILIAARPGMGKTSLALNVALNAAKKSGKTIAFFSLEMSREQLGMRLMSNESFVDNQKLVTGRLSEDEWAKIGLASSALSQTDIRVDDNPTITVAEINAKCRRLDNLALKNPGLDDKTRDYLEKIDGSAKHLLELINDILDMSRIESGRMISDLRESGAIEQDADIVLFLYRDDYYHEDSPEKNVAECIVAKNRHGETGTVRLQWLPQFTTFSDREWQHDEP